jgi:hypothetical protein
MSDSSVDCRAGLEVDFVPAEVSSVGRLSDAVCKTGGVAVLDLDFVFRGDERHGDARRGGSSLSESHRSIGASDEPRISTVAAFFGDRRRGVVPRLAAELDDTSVCVRLSCATSGLGSLLAFLRDMRTGVGLGLGVALQMISSGVAVASIAGRDLRVERRNGTGVFTAVGASATSAVGDDSGVTGTIFRAPFRRRTIGVAGDSTAVKEVEGEGVEEAFDNVFLRARVGVGVADGSRVSVAEAVDDVFWRLRDDVGDRDRASEPIDSAMELVGEAPRAGCVK